MVMAMAIIMAPGSDWNDVEVDTDADGGGGEDEDEKTTSDGEPSERSLMITRLLQENQREFHKRNNNNQQQQQQQHRKLEEEEESMLLPPLGNMIAGCNLTLQLVSARKFVAGLDKNCRRRCL